MRDQSLPSYPRLRQIRKPTVPNLLEHVVKEDRQSQNDARDAKNEQHFQVPAASDAVDTWRGTVVKLQDTAVDIGAAVGYDVDGRADACRTRCLTDDTSLEIGGVEAAQLDVRFAVRHLED
jgi:DUF4097 and DUF4098 domain-containing protein YvlB